MSGTSRECRHEETGHIQGIEKAAQQILKKKKTKTKKNQRNGGFQSGRQHG